MMVKFDERSLLVFFFGGGFRMIKVPGTIWDLIV